MGITRAQESIHTAIRLLISVWHQRASTLCAKRVTGAAWTLIFPEVCIRIPDSIEVTVISTLPSGNHGFHRASYVVFGRQNGDLKLIFLIHENADQNPWNWSLEAINLPP